jgi:hypothetical protein
MGFYIRKALKVGPLRFNLSRSGIGVSAGIKGLRLGTGPRGNYVHMGRGGLYFRKTLNPSNHEQFPPASEPLAPRPAPSDALESLQEIESGSVLGMVDASSAELLQELKEKRQRPRLVPVAITLSAIVLIVAILGDMPISLIVLCAAIAGGATWLASVEDTLRKTTVIFYDLEPEMQRAFQELHDTVGLLLSCGRIWHIEAQGDVTDRKYHAGAGSLMRRSEIALRTGDPPFVKTNVEIPLFPVGRQVLAFMPDRLLVFDERNVGAVSYQDLSVGVSETRFIEEDPLPHDATVIDTTWRYVNKNGGPDRRFNNNCELPICAYEEIHLSSENGLNELIQVSHRGAGSELATALAALCQPIKCVTEI